MQQFINIQIP